MKKNCLTQPKIIAFGGFSGNGKTSLIEKLIPLFIKGGYETAAVKSDAHHFEIDHEGKDSYRLKKAGANAVLLSSREKFALIYDEKANPASSITEKISWLLPNFDIVLMEGFHAEDRIPRVIVTVADKLPPIPFENVIAVVYNPYLEKNEKTILKNQNCLKKLGKPLFLFHQVEEIFVYLQERLSL